MLKGSMAPGKVGDREAGAAITPSSLQKKTAHKGSRPRYGRTPESSSFAVSHHLPRAQRSVSLFDHLPVMTSVAHRVVQQIALDRSHSRTFVHRYGFMNQAFAPVPLGSFKKPKLIIR